MANFEVSIAPKGASPIETRTVEAGDGYDALWLAMEPFKTDPRVCDAVSWDVTVRRLPDA